MLATDDLGTEREAELVELSGKAREGKLGPSEMIMKQRFNVS